MKKFQEIVKNDLEYIGKYIFNEHNMGNKVKQPSKNNVPLVMAHWHIAVRLISEKLHCVSKFLSKKSFLVNLTTINSCIIYWRIAIPYQLVFHEVFFFIKYSNTAWKVSNYGVFSGPYFLAFGLNTERYVFFVFSLNARKYRPKKTLNLDTFHAV